MNRRFSILELLAYAALVLIGISTTALAGPPPPPTIAGAIPSTPVGGPEVTIATAAVIAGYGYWKSRK